MKYDSAIVFPIVQGLEILYFGKECMEKLSDNYSELIDMQATIALQKCLIDDFCIIYQIGKSLPSAFERYGCDIVILVNAELLKFEDMQAFPEIWKFIQGINEVFKLDEQFCVFKTLPKMKEVYEELHQVSFPPKMFRFYILLKSMELFLLLSDLKPYSTQVHFYPYKI